MDFFQGSTPPNFISFCLVNSSEGEPQTQPQTSSDIPVETVSTTIVPTTSSTVCRPVPSPTPFPPIRTHGTSTDSAGRITSTSNTDENLQPPEEAQPSVPQQPPLFRTSTPTQDLANTATGLSLTQLETALTVAPSSRTTLPELLPVVTSTNEISAVSFLQTETDDGSSTCDAPRLPTGEIKVRYLDDSTGAEETGDTSSQASGQPLYGFVPISTAGERRGEESSSETFAHFPDPSQPGTSVPHDSAIRELSGRSRAILKQYFDEDASTISFPLGHRTVAFTEPQVYHLLRVLTDETLKMSYETMERMVIGAVKGAPITSESKTGHFKLRRRAQTPGPGQQRDSSDSSQDTSHFGFGTDTSEEASSDKEERGIDSFNDSDSSGEMALISQAFGETSGPGPTTQEIANINPNKEGFESAGQSSLDATLSELRGQSTPPEPPAPSSGKQPKKKKRGPTRGVPMKEEFFSKIGWTRLLYFWAR